MRATVAHQAGQPEDALTELRAAVAGFESADMRLYAAATRRRLGALVGRTEGRELVVAADAFMREESIVNPEAMTRMLAPGW